MTTFVKKQPGQSEDQLIAQFRKKIFNEDVLEEISKRDFYQPPSVAKHERLKDLRKKKKKKRPKKGTG